MAIFDAKIKFWGLYKLFDTQLFNLQQFGLCSYKDLWMSNTIFYTNFHEWITNFHEFLGAFTAHS